jgi:hypothetical protein
MKTSNSLRKAIVATIITPLMLSNVLVQGVRAEMFQSLSAGQEAWVTVPIGEGRHAIIANSPGSMGDVDIYLYNSEYELLLKSTDFGTDRLDFTVSQGGTFYLKYRMNTCMNPFGPCNVSLDFF